jgi:outer membrane protein assembly factor BamB
MFLSVTALSADYENQALRILDAAGVKGGFVVHIGCADGKLTAHLRENEKYMVQGLDSDPENVHKAREYIQSLRVYGKVSIDGFDGERLPYVDNLVNLVVCENLGKVPLSEIMRVLAPYGVAYIKQSDKWRKTVKPYPGDIDDWTHYLHDASGNAVAADKKVGPPKHIRWLAGPLWSRSHEFNPSLNALVSGGGRIFYIYDEGIPGLPDLRLPARWSLFARDAFNGKFLWKRPVPNWGYREWNTRGMWSAPLTLNRRVVTDGQRVYATLGYKAPLTILDAATGNEVRTVDNTEGTDEIILTDAALLLCVRDRLSVASPPKQKPKRRLNPHEWSIAAPGPAEIVALDTKTDRELWRLKPQPVTVLTLAALGDYVLFYAADEVVCLDLKTGKRNWTTPVKRQRGPKHSGGNLVIHDDVVLFTGAEGLKAFSAENGKQLWTGPKVSGPGISHPPDLFVADGLVWSGDIAGTHHRDRTAVWRQGRDLKTGRVQRTVAVGNLISPLHHFRCYRSKATDRFLMLTKRGVEFVDLNGNEHMRHDWLRAMCHYGFMPCNGLLYVPPHHCFCYPGVKMTGFLALSAEQPKGRNQKNDAPKRLQHGPSYNKAKREAAGPHTTDNWPTYRRDPMRSGHTKTAVPAKIGKLWDTNLGGKITQPVIAQDKLYVARKDSHSVHCLNPHTGEELWKFTAGARIDSPPTIHSDLVLFGCRDGWVYCLSAADGNMCWRFRAAPDDRRIVAFDQVESAWPVPGSVLVLDGVAYVAAGRSSFLDGGICLYGLEPRTGKLLCETKVEGPWPDVHKEIGRPFDMEGTKSDILVSDGNHLFLYQMAFDKQLNDVTPPRTSSLGDRKMGRHLIATGGFLHDLWYDRTYWTYSDRWPGFYYANAAPKAGQILVFDEQTTYGLHVYTSRLRLSPAFTPGSNGYELFADNNQNEPALASNSIGREKGPGFSRTAPPKWSRRIPLRARAMVLAADKLFIAGPPDVMPDDDPYAAFEGRKGARLWVLSAKDGKKLAQYPLQSQPALDGLIAAAGRLFLSTTDGRVLCFAGLEYTQPTGR